MKRCLIAPLGALALFVSCSAPAQVYTTHTLLAGANVNANCVSNYTASTNMVAVAKYSDVAVSATFAFVDASASSNIVFSFQRSLDGSTWETLGKPTIVTLSANGATARTIITNFTMDAHGYIRLNGIQNDDDTQGMTNITVKAATKPKRFG